MTRRAQESTQAAAVVCPYCHARIGQQCHNRSGAPIPDPHGSRLQVARQLAAEGGPTVPEWTA